MLRICSKRSNTIFAYIGVYLRTNTWLVCSIS